MFLGDRRHEDVVLLDSATDTTVTVGTVRDRAAELGGASGLTLLLAGSSVEAYRDCLALLEAKQPVALVDPDLGEAALLGLVARYRPGRVVSAPHHAAVASVAESFGAVESEPGVLRFEHAVSDVHPELALLLTTSGTTGSQRFVRLSWDNVLVNARQIAEALSLGPDDRALSTMPLFYSFGLSILTSHAASGGSVAVSGSSVIEQRFWDDLERSGATIMGGVPTTYKMLRRLGFEQRDTGSLRALIQAGGRLDTDSIGYFHDAMAKRGGRFHVMYGQTEASPRMSVLPSEWLPAKLGSVGLPVPRATIRVVGAQDERLPAGQPGRVVFEGPNVMMGYADSSDDLAVGDAFGARLDTGDEGYLDSDGFLYLTGRTKRICKLAGIRTSLDEVEVLVADLVPHGKDVAADSRADDALSIYVEGLTEGQAREIRSIVAKRLRVPPKLVNVESRDTLPRLPNGKTDYRALAPTEVAL